MTTLHTPRGRAWRTSSYSDSARQCVEVGQAGTACLVRDTRDRTAGSLAFSSRTWTTFTLGIKNGGFPSSANR
jgi:Domain of unknown function (DUF397)